MHKKIISFILLLAMLISVFPTPNVYAENKAQNLDVIQQSDGSYLIKLSNFDDTSLRSTTVARRAPAPLNPINPVDNPDEFDDKQIKVSISDLVIKVLKIEEVKVTVKTRRLATYSQEYTVKKNGDVTQGDKVIGEPFTVPLPKQDKYNTIIVVKLVDGRDARNLVEAKSKTTGLEVNIGFIGHTGVETKWYGNGEKPNVKAKYRALADNFYEFDLPTDDESLILRKGTQWVWKDHPNVTYKDLAVETYLRCTLEEHAMALWTKIDGKTEGQLANSNYYFKITGDALYGFLVTSREKVSVDFNAGKGTWKSGNAPATQYTGYGLTFKEAFIATPENLGPITVPNAATDLTPPAKAAGQTTDNEFKGWSATGENGPVVDLAKYKINGNTTFTALYGPKADGKVEVEYVDESGTKIKDKYKISTEPYPTEVDGNEGEDVDATKIPQPKFIGYERTADPIDVTGKTYKKVDSTTKLDVVQVKYKKLPSVIPGKDPNGGDHTKPEGYVTVTFKAGQHGKINDGTADIKFFVNPKDDVKFGDSRIVVPSIEAVGDYVVKTPNWDPDLNDAKKKEAITANTTFTAQYDEKGKHTVTFDADNGTAKTTEKVVDGKTATKPATDPTKKGYTFEAWHLLTNGNLSGTAYDFSTPVKSDITLKAVYNENYVRFEYVSEDTSKGSVDNAEETIKAATGEAKGSTATAANGYRFTHWTKDGDKTFKAETAQLTPQKIDGVYVAAKFTAHFAKEVSVKYDLNAPSGLTAKGNAPTDDKKYIAGEKADVKALPQDAGVDGCEFLGWNTDKSAKTATYNANDKIDIAGDKDVTLYAIWKKGTKTVKLSFEFYKKKGTGNILQPDNALGDFKKPKLENLTGQEVGAEITLPTYQVQIVNTGDLQGTWTFDGWYKDENKVIGNPTVSATDADNQYVGKWILEETKTATVTREFVIDSTIIGAGKDVPTGHELPEDVKKQKPNDTQNYIGSTQTPGKDKFTAVPETINGKQGTWTFKEWNPTKLTVNEDESKNVFTGIWTWTEKLVRPVDPDHPDKQPDEVEVKFLKGEHGKLSGIALVGGNEVEVTGRDELAYYVKTKNTKGEETTWAAMKGYIPTAVADYGWSVANPSWKPVLPEATINVERGEKEFTAQYVERPTDITLTLDENYRNGKITDYDVEEDELIRPYLYTPHRRGYVFEGWSYNSRHLEEVRPGDRIYEPTVLYAIWTKDRAAKDKRETEPKDTRKVYEHSAYIFGYPDGSVRPNGNITRAEAAAMLARLLNLEALASDAKPMFPDTPSSWYNKAINAVVARGIMKGYPDGRFRPNAPITRAEFTTMIAAIDNKAYGVAPFADVKGHWAELAIGREYQAGRINGYPDGTFRPNAPITRAEVATILNKVFDRCYDAMSLLGTKNKEYVRLFTDLYQNFWAYYDIVEATNNHSFKLRNELKGVQEDWVEIK